MAINKNTDYGTVLIKDSAISSTVGKVVSECYGIVGVTAKKVRDSFYDLFNRNNIGKGIIVSNKDNKVKIDIHVIASYGVKISEVVNELQKRVKYTLEKTFNVDIVEVNVFVEKIKEIVDEKPERK